METIENLYHIYEIEGHGYALEHYKGTIKECESEELKDIWNEAVISINKLTKFFQDKVDSGELEFFEY